MGRKGRATSRRLPRSAGGLDRSIWQEASPLVIAREDVAVLGLEPAGLDEADLLARGVRPQDPGEVFHLAKGRMAPIRVSGTERDGEANEVVAVGEAIAMHDLLAKALALDDGGMPAGHAERRFAMLDR